MPKTLCHCGGVKSSGVCDRCGHGKRGARQAGKTTKERGYGHDWRMFSERIRRERPMCEDCLAMGKVKPSAEVHHKEKIKHNPQRRLDPNNVMALCVECHKERTRKGE